MTAFITLYDNTTFRENKKSKLYLNKWLPVLVALGQTGDWADAGIIEVIRVDTVME